MTDRAIPARVSLILSDVDGTLVTRDKLLTERTLEAVRRVRAAQVTFAVASSRPPFGLRSVRKSLDLSCAFACFNGGLVLAPDDEIIVANYVPADVAAEAIEFFESRGLQVWAFTASQWLCRDAQAPYVAHEQNTVSQAPTLVASFAPYLGALGKIVAVSADANVLEQCERAVQARLGARAMAARSQSYYLDVTHPAANKADALRAIAGACGAPLSECVAIGDGGNDAVMLETAAYGIAMGNAVEAVKSVADFVTGSNEEEGFAMAMEHLLEKVR